MIAPLSFFTEHFNITVSDIENLLSVALSKGGDYADLYFEYSVSSNINLEEQIIKSANRSVTQGVGVRFPQDEKTRLLKMRIEEVLGTSISSSKPTQTI